MGSQSGWDPLETEATVYSLPHLGQKPVERAVPVRDGAVGN
ncbi:hypothetical protein VULLAG_LOCUS5079 [Vulpes lagopus]